MVIVSKYLLSVCNNNFWSFYGTQQYHKIWRTAFEKWTNYYKLLYAYYVAISNVYSQHYVLRKYDTWLSFNSRLWAYIFTKGIEAYMNLAYIYTWEIKWKGYHKQDFCRIYLKYKKVLKLVFKTFERWRGDV